MPATEMSEGRGQTLPASPIHGRHPYGLSEGHSEWNFNLFDEHSQGLARAMGFTPESRNEAGMMLVVADQARQYEERLASGQRPLPRHVFVEDLFFSVKEEEEEETPIAGGRGAGGGQTLRIDEQVAKVD